jgi:hypothetical protein
MKKLLSLVALLALAAALPAEEATAGLRGSFDPLSIGSEFNNGIANGCQTPALRPLPFSANGGVAKIEMWYCFTTRSQTPGQESSREIWMARNSQQIGRIVEDILDARQPLKKDPSGLVSYTDPAWSPNGKYLMWVETDNNLTHTALYYQEYMVSTDRATAGTTVGAPVLVLGPTVGVKYRHPDWSPDGNSIVFDSDATGLSVDLYTMSIFPLGAPVRRTFVDNRGESNPAWAPDGVRIAYDTNKFGPNVIEILNTSTNALSLAETNFATVSHSNPDWDAASNIYYDAPQSEDNQQNQDIWRINPVTQAKCPILFDARGDVNVSVSQLTNTTIDGISYSTYVFESQATGALLGIWRGNPVQSCLAPLTMGVDVSPKTINIDAPANGNSEIELTLSYPPETLAAGYVCRAANVGGEGMRMRTTILASPTFMGLTAIDQADFFGDPNLGGLAYYTEDLQHATMTVRWTRRAVTSRLVALGLLNSTVYGTVNAYSNITGRGFQGFAAMHLSTSSFAGSAVALRQNSPNPFNPVTTIKYATSKPGHVTLRIYNVQGALVKTLADKHVDAGDHEVSWDGRNQSGKPVTSGVYYAKVFSAGGSSDVIKMVMAK